MARRNVQSYLIASIGVFTLLNLVIIWRNHVSTYDPQQMMGSYNMEAVGTEVPLETQFGENADLPEKPPVVEMTSRVTCPGLSFSQKMKESQTFQKIAKIDTYVYSAHLDEGFITILSLRGGHVREKKLFCQIWINRTSEDPLVVIQATVVNVPESHGRKYTASFVRCQLPKGLWEKSENIKSVSVTNTMCENASNKLPVVPSTRSTNFTVCVTPLNFHYKSTDQLVEMIEMNRILGAQRIAFYNHSTSPVVDKILAHYMNTGVVDVHQWPLPMKTNTWPSTGLPEVHYFAQLASINDCLKRYARVSQYLVFQDLDEFIVPQTRDLTDWHSLVKHREKLKPNAVAFYFRCVFYRREWPKSLRDFPANDIAEKYKSIILRHIVREKEVLQQGHRSKFIVKPLKVNIVGIHNVWDARGPVDHVPPAEGRLHHYRSWDTPNDKRARVNDGIAIHKFGMPLAKKLKNAWERLVIMGVPLPT